MIDHTAELLRIPGRLLFCPHRSATFNQCQKKRIVPPQVDFIRLSSAFGSFVVSTRHYLFSPAELSSSK
jgi:hypothetical protein